jgi:hypothetical protein
MDKQLENLFNFSNNHKNIFLLINKIEQCGNGNSEFMSNFANLMEKYNLNYNKVHIIQPFNSVVKDFKSFLLKSLMRKKSNSCPVKKSVIETQNLYYSPEKKNLINHFLRK